jgi:hypothetical protein
MNVEVESCTFTGPSLRYLCKIRRDGPSTTSHLRSFFGDIFVTRFTRIYPLGRVPGSSYTRILVYSPLETTRSLVTRMFPPGEYSFYSHTRIIVHSLLKNLWFARLLVCSFARLLVYSLTGLLVSCTSPWEVHSFCSCSYWDYLCL